MIKHKINMTDEIAIYTRQYRYPQVYKEEIEKQVKDLLKKDIIQQLFSMELARLDCSQKARCFE